VKVESEYETEMTATMAAESVWRRDAEISKQFDIEIDPNSEMAAWSVTAFVTSPHCPHNLETGIRGRI
jgi:hypothetical protein